MLCLWVYGLWEMVYMKGKGNFGMYRKATVHRAMALGWKGSVPYLIVTSKIPCLLCFDLPHRTRCIQFPSRNFPRRS